MSVQAVLLAGDRGAAKAVRGRSKAFLAVGGKPMLVHVFDSLVHTPEVREIFVVGDAIRIEKTLAAYGCLDLAVRRSCPVHIVPQRDSLYENVWHSFLRTRPPDGGDAEHPILVVPSDIPLVVPEEISEFVRQAEATNADHVAGVSTDLTLAAFGPRDDAPGIEMACFNLAEGRFRQSNLHYVRPLKLGNRHYVQDLYENRFQKQLGSAVRLGWTILVREFRHLWVLLPYLLTHVAGVLDRRGHRRAAGFFAARVSLRTVERALGALLDARFVTVTTAFGGAAIDVDNEADLAVVDKMIEPWKALQIRRSPASLSIQDAAAPPAACADPRA